MGVAIAADLESQVAKPARDANFWVGPINNGRAMVWLYTDLPTAGLIELAELLERHGADRISEGHSPPQAARR